MSAHIVVFDSGVGGLSIVQQLDRMIGDYRLSYIFDNALFPYGDLQPEVLRQRVATLLIPFCREHRPDLIIIGCNTASTVVLPDLRAALPIPVVGVVPAIKPAARITQTGCIGLLATPGTVTRPYTQQLINTHASHCRVLRLGSSELVRVIENFLGDNTLDMTALSRIVDSWREETQLDTVILGCTHFPLIRAQLQQLFGEQVQLVDSGAAIARRTQDLLHLSLPTPGKSKRHAYCTLMNGHCRQLHTVFTRLRFEPLSVLPTTETEVVSTEGFIPLPG